MSPEMYHVFWFWLFQLVKFVMAVLVFAPTALIEWWLFSFINANIASSIKVRQALKVHGTSSQNSTTRLGNSSVSRSRVVITQNTVHIVIPTVPSWHLLPSNDIRENVLTRVRSPEFNDFLQLNFAEYTFGQPDIKHRSLTFIGTL